MFPSLKLILEGSISSKKILRRLKTAKKSPGDFKLHRELGKKVAKWWEKKKLRTNKPSYQKSLED